MAFGKLLKLSGGLYCEFTWDVQVVETNRGADPNINSDRLFVMLAYSRSDFVKRTRFENGPIDWDLLIANLLFVETSLRNFFGGINRFRASM